MFVAACVLYALRHAGTEAAGDIARGTVRFLLREMRPPGVWSYWTAASGKRIDPDLDDTALISFLLRRHHPHLALGSNVAAVLSARDEAGRFRTWLREPDRPNDVDAVVNANVVLYLGERAETAAARAYLRECVRAGREPASYRYYLDDSALHYAVSRAAWHGSGGLDDLRDVLVEQALRRQRPDGSFGDELCSAWTVSTLFNARGERPEAIARGLAWLRGTPAAGRRLARRRRVRGPGAAGAADPALGLAELTTAACVEALARALATGS